MSDRILVINAGSSSLKFQVLDLPSGDVVAKGTLERITDHAAAIHAMVAALADSGIDIASVTAVGHRVVHGGELYTRPTRIDADVITGIESLVPLAPLHNPGNLLGIRAMVQQLPDVPQVAVFDTAFHATIPAHAATYAIDADVAERYGIRRFGFHGSSHKFVTAKTAELLGVPLDQVNLIICHIGNGASITAVQGGNSVDTSMGLTPLEGLVMGTRSGDLDPGIVFHLARVADFDFARLDTLLNRQSGLFGMCGSGDMREVRKRANAGDPDARLALDVYGYRLRKYIGAYLAAVPDVHALVFTAGVGENDAEFRNEVVGALAHLGVGSRIPVLVVPTNEELEIAHETLAAMS
jgi:acetate kinase